MSAVHFAVEDGRTLAAADHWDLLAEEQERLVASGDVHAGAGRARAETYRKAAVALRIEARTGTPVCVCCHKPVQRLDILGREVKS